MKKRCCLSKEDIHLWQMGQSQKGGRFLDWTVNIIFWADHLPICTPFELVLAHSNLLQIFILTNINTSNIFILCCYKNFKKIIKIMGNTSSMLTQYDIEEVQEHCNHTCMYILCLFCSIPLYVFYYIHTDKYL